MTTTTTHSGGKFVWRELMTHDVEGAKRFYGTLFGWKWDAVPLGEGRPPYTRAYQGEDDYLAGVLDLECEQPTAFWAPYIYVENVDEATKTAVESGAHLAMPPTDLPGVGRFAFLNDPQGAPFYLYCPSGEGEETPPRVGEFCWEHLNTTDPAGAIAFYNKVVGWSAQPMGPVSFFMRDNGTQPVAVVSQAPAGVPAHWLSYVMVEDLAATNARAKALGGEVIEERIEVPGKGAFALLKDPAGALFMLSEPS